MWLDRSKTGSRNAAGDLTADGTLTFTWNAEERLTATAGVTYTHDGDGWRVKKSNGTIHWRSLSGDILAETDLSGNNLREYVYFAGRRVARRDNSGTIYYFLQDHLGSTRVITNASGSIVRESDYYPHGTEKLVSGTVDDPHKFAGMYLDSESGLYYTWFRMYSPTLGRWLSSDPARCCEDNPQALDRYVYVVDNPTNTVHPLGLQDRESLNATTYIGDSRMELLRVPGFSPVTPSFGAQGVRCDSFCLGVCLPACGMIAQDCFQACNQMPPGPPRKWCYAGCTVVVLACVGLCLDRCCTFSCPVRLAREPSARPVALDNRRWWRIGADYALPGMLDRRKLACVATDSTVACGIGGPWP